MKKLILFLALISICNPLFADRVSKRLTLATISSKVPASDTEVIYMDGTSLDGDAGMTYNKTTDSLTLVGTVQGEQITSTDDMQLLGDILATSGTLTIGGTGNTNNENLTFDFETNPNESIFSSTSGSQIVYAIDQKIGDLYNLKFGGSSDTQIRWETTGNDNLQIGTIVGSATDSGYICFMEKADMGNANRSPSGTTNDTTGRFYSADATQANDFIEISHNQTDGQITAGNGNINLSPATGSSVVVSGSSSQLYFSNSTATIAGDAGADLTSLTIGATDEIRDGIYTRTDSVSLADDATQALPDAVTGVLTIWVEGDDDSAIFYIEDDATVTLSLTISGSVANSDSDTNLCVYDGGGTQAFIKNRLGATKTVCYRFDYK